MNKDEIDIDVEEQLLNDLYTAKHALIEVTHSVDVVTAKKLARDALDILDV